MGEVKKLSVKRMGCMILSPQEHVKQQQAAMQSAFTQNAPEPYITATGQISVPITIMTGEWSKKYPIWIEEWGVSKQEYGEIIATLENATKPLADSMWQSQANINMNPLKAHQNAMNHMNQVMAGAANFQKIPHAIESTLYTLNQTVFEKKGLQALSSAPLGSLGIVIFKKGNPPPQTNGVNSMQMSGLQMTPQQQEGMMQQLQQMQQGQGMVIKQTYQ